MAGRGTDIKLGEGVQDLGGLKIIGTERHESRRIDNQLRGRAGRQGDPGESRFYISLEDELMRLFGSEKTAKVIAALGLPEDEPIEHNMLSKAIEGAQKKVEGNNFSARKRLLDYDKVMNEQREIIYAQRLEVLKGENLKESIFKMIKEVVKNCVNINCASDDEPDQWDIRNLNDEIVKEFAIEPVKVEEEDFRTITKDKLIEEIYDKAVERYNAREAEIGEEMMREIERVITLKVVDSKWMDHIDDMDQMRQGIGLRSYGQRDPLVEYQFISYDMFDELSSNIQQEIVRGMFHVQVRVEQPMQREQVAKPTSTNMDDTAVSKPKTRQEPKVGRNDLCPCGSGKKYKYCCGKDEK
jgi:preprotein translocase subunit SecA